MFTRFLTALLSLVLTLQFASTRVLAQTPDSARLQQRAEDVVSVFQGTADADDVFDKAFLAQVSAAQLDQINSQLTAQFGDIIAVESLEAKGPTNAKVIFRFERALGTATLNIAGADPFKVNGLLLQTFDPIDDDLDKIRTELEALPGSTGVLLSSLDFSEKPIFSHNDGRQFAIGSTFKLYVLSALARSIESGERQWSDVVTINRRSFPSGMMQNWPDGAPVTLQTLATMMISISDNTATDILLHELGRNAVESELLSSGHSQPDRTLPFLSTLELFALKGSPQNAAKYIAADDVGKRRILIDFEDDIRGDPDQIKPPRFSSPTEIDTLEWFASALDIRRILRRIVELDDPTARNIMAVSNAMPDARANDWSYVGYKGGSEPGVLNLSWLLQSKSGEWYVLTLSWNNEAADVDKTTLDLLAQRLITFAE